MSVKDAILHVWLPFHMVLGAGLSPSSSAAPSRVIALFFAGLRPNISLPLILGSGCKAETLSQPAHFSQLPDSAPLFAQQGSRQLLSSKAFGTMFLPLMFFTV